MYHWNSVNSLSFLAIESKVQGCIVQVYLITIDLFITHALRCSIVAKTSKVQSKDFLIVYVPLASGFFKNVKKICSIQTNIELEFSIDLSIKITIFLDRCDVTYGIHIIKKSNLKFPQNSIDCFNNSQLSLYNLKILSKYQLGVEAPYEKMMICDFLRQVATKNTMYR